MKKKSFWILLLTIVAGIVIVAIAKKPAVPEFSSATVERKDLVQSVEETGQVAAELDIIYGFEMNGKVVVVNNAVGDLVQQGDVIAEIDNTSQLQALRQAQATLASVQAALNLKLAGPSAEASVESQAGVDKAKATLRQAEADFARAQVQAQTDVDTAQKNLETAQNNLRLVQETGSSQILDDAYSDLLNDTKAAIPTLRDGLTEADDILGIDNKQANDDFENVLSIWSQEALNKAKNSYYTAKTSKVSAESMVNTTFESNGEDGIISAAIAMTDALNAVRQLLIDTSAALDATPPVGITQTILDSLKTGVTAELSSINAGISSIAKTRQDVNEAKIIESSYQIAYEKAILELSNTKQRAKTTVALTQSAVDIQKAALAQAEAAHAKLIAPPRNVDVASLRADVARYDAAVTASQKELDRTQLTAITTGTIATVDIKIGENVTANQKILEVISSELTIEVDVSESEIAKIQIEDPVEITLDAFGDDIVFDGHVVSIEPAETEISGVIYYKTDIIFDDMEGYNIRPGMTANVRIITDTKQNVLVIPQRAILTTDSKKVVRVLTDINRGLFEEREIKTGIRGDGGNIEITAGLSEGEEIITFLKED